ncbi:hypothetical protein [Compostimonas suwonensis]|uniref:Uncharacterized protein n=1 Tax=Compostimonas suwonensis TaxID=1048394 RepID=A0A2M9C3S0_9MICO|nr:hypothetical protein [Compostimonas suwonensis]PJJ65168.1 hypothetical protein CLV54_0197 [Compostimonas suwonensis]
MAGTKDDRIKRRRLAGALIGAGFDEVFNPSAKFGRETWEAAQDLSVPVPSPGDEPDLESGRIVIVEPPDAAER